MQYNQKHLPLRAFFFLYFSSLTPNREGGSHVTQRKKIHTVNIRDRWLYLKAISTGESQVGKSKIRYPILAVNLKSFSCKH